MIRRFFKYVLILTVIALIAFFFLAGKIADRSYNQVVEIDNYQISEEAKKLHEKLLIADLHADNLLWDRNHNEKLGHGMVDIPRLLEGNYALQVFDAVIKTPKNQNYDANTGDTDNITTLAIANRWPPQTWFSLKERAIHQSNILKDAALSSSALEIIYNKADLRYFMSIRKSNSYKVGGILSIEGLHALEGDFDNLEILYNAGYRMMGLVHFFDNEVGGSSAGTDKGGLTDFGRRVVREMEKKKIIIDLAHASPALIRDVISIANRPLIVSHTGVKGTYNSPRNLSDEEIRLIANKGGLIGIGFWAEAVGSTRPQDIARAIRYVSDLVGIDHVALGSDFDGAVITSFDTANIIYLTEALLREGFLHEEIEKIMGGNQIRFFMENLPD